MDGCSLPFRLTRGLAQCAFFGSCLVVVVNWIRLFGGRSKYYGQAAILAAACYSAAELYLSDNDVPNEWLGPANQATAAVILVFCQCSVLYLACSYRTRTLQQQAQNEVGTFVMVFALCAVLLAVRASLLLWIATDWDRATRCVLCSV